MAKTHGSRQFISSACLRYEKFLREGYTFREGERDRVVKGAASQRNGEASEREREMMDGEIERNRGAINLILAA